LARVAGNHASQKNMHSLLEFTAQMNLPDLPNLLQYTWVEVEEIKERTYNYYFQKH
jgi:hypothetical protein